MSGWIKLYRDINNHWLWQNSDYFKWWVDILLEVNHTPSKFVIKNKLYECERGQKLYSLDTWAKRWNTNKSKVKRFLDLLEKDKMIVLKSETQTTRLTVCNYDSYQEKENANETQTKRKRNANETQTTPIQECNNNKNENNEENNNTPLAFSFYNSLLNYGFNKDLVSDWIKVRKTKRLTNTETAYKKFIIEVEKCNLDKNKVLEECVSKSWGGLNAEWLKNEKQIKNEHHDGFHSNR